MALSLVEKGSKTLYLYESCNKYVSICLFLYLSMYLSGKTAIGPCVALRTVYRRSLASSNVTKLPGNFL